jgi:hypothetical protein
MWFFRFMAIVVLLLACVVLGSACAGAKGEQGENGADGVGIQSIANNTDGTLTVYLTNGQSYTTGDLTGPQGATGLPGVGIAWQGEWSSTLTYGKHDGVGYLGSSYVSKQASNTNHLPTDTAWWDLWVEKGDTGEQGTQGIQGLQGEAGPNMVVAMGFIIGDGTVGRGYNVTSCSWNATHEYYEITLTGINYITGRYVTLATICGSYSYPVYESIDGKLCVTIVGSSGNPTMNSFSFMVLRAPSWNP